MPSLSIVIPAYNEEGGIADISNRVLAVRESLRQVNVELKELLVVDDGSKDRTAEIVRGIAGATLIKHTKNRGYGGALKTGFNAAQGDLIGFLDADGTYPPEYFPQLCISAMQGADLVIGSRMAGAESHMPPTRRLGNFLFANLLTFISNRRVTDSASGMRVFKREALPRMYPLPNGLNLTPVMSTRALHENLTVTEVPIPYSERVGRSKLSVIKDGVRFLNSIVWTALSYNPASLMGKTGLVLAGVAGLIFLWLLSVRLSGVTELDPFGVAALFTALVSGVAGVSVYSLGVTFNYLVSMFYKRPVRQGVLGRPIFKRPLESHFGWVGLLSIAVSAASAGVFLWLGFNGWDVSRLWLYLLGSAMLGIVGIQLLFSWIIVRVLAELSQRDELAQKDLAQEP